MAQPGVAAGRKRADVINDYEGFVKKFEQPKTTDDCMTPPAVYEVVAEYVSERYGLDKAAFVRPFWPGADYQAFDYKPGQVVVDNPPFSILSKICAWYEEKSIDFFLFAPGQTAMNFVRLPGRTVIFADADIVYDNGANVRTAFVTSLEPEHIAVADPVLCARVMDAVRRTLEEKKGPALPIYTYPSHIVTGSLLQKYAFHGVPFSIRRDEAVFVRKLDAQTAYKKAIYGGGLLLSDGAAAEHAAAERAAAEHAAAGRAATGAAEAHVWALSDREKGIVKNLGGTTNA